MRKRELWKNLLMLLMCSALVLPAPITYAASNEANLNVPAETVSLGAPAEEKNMPAAALSDESAKLITNIRCTASYRNHITTGNAAIFSPGTGYSNGIVNKSVKITRISVSKAKASKISTQNYSGKRIKPRFTLKVNGKSLKRNRDYTVSFQNNINIGTARITIKGKGNYTGTKTLKFKIVPRKPSIRTLSSPKAGQLKINWYKDKQASGYVITYAQDRAFKKGKKTVSVKNKNTTSKTILKLAKGKKYYVKIQSYKIIKGTKYMSAYSSVKTANVKKGTAANHKHTWKEGSYKTKTKLTDIWLTGYTCYLCGVIFNIDMDELKIDDNDDIISQIEGLYGTTKKEKLRVYNLIKAHNYKESIFDHCGSYCPQDDDEFHLCNHLYNIDLVTQINVNYRVPTEYVCSCGERKKITVNNCKHSLDLIIQDGLDRYTAKEREKFAAPDPKYLKARYSGFEFSERTIKRECLTCGKTTVPTPPLKQRLAALKNYNKIQGADYKKENLRSIQENW